MELKQRKKLYTLFSKMTTIFPSFYIIKPYYVVTKESGKPYMAELDEKWIPLLEEFFGEFTVLHVKDIKLVKKVIAGPTRKDDPETFPKLEDQFYHVTNPRELFEVKELFTSRMKSVTDTPKWESFLLSEDPEENEKLLKSLFVDNSYVNFKPKGDEFVPMIILTTSLIPLVSEKNYNNLYYCCKKVIEGLYEIIFDFQFEMFRLYMYHTYIPIEITVGGDNNEES